MFGNLQVMRISTDLRYFPVFLGGLRVICSGEQKLIYLGALSQSEQLTIIKAVTK